MTLHISESSEQFVRSQVRAGRYATEGEVVEDALRLLERQERAGDRTLAEDEFQRHLLAIGLMSRLPDVEADADDPDDQPVTIEGEPLSATVIRERR